MSDRMEDSNVEPTVTIKQQCIKCFKGPNCIKTIVILLCVALVVQQLSACIQKLIDIPITTYTHFDYNKTINYPSITFCREPPYKAHVLEAYNLSAHPRYTSAWRNFNFSNITLDDLWERITYSEEEVFVAYGLDNLRENVKVTSTLGFYTGRCYTLSPKVMDIVARAGMEYGYSVTLKHFSDDVEASLSVIPPGYHVHIHYVREPFTEVEVYNGGLVDYLYINTGETVSVKLTVNEYVMITNDEEPCTHADNYSANNCTTQFVTDFVAEEANCSGPWMSSPFPYCNNFNEIRNLIVAYGNKYQNHNCSSCPRFCRSYLYNAFVTNRQKYYMWDTQNHVWGTKSAAAALQTTIYFHFNNMMVSVYEERYNYDWNVFLSDLGGSVGFLLGLSVIGVINIIGYIWMYFIMPFVCKKNKKDGSDSTNLPSSLAAINNNFKKCDQWNNDRNPKD